MAIKNRSWNDPSPNGYSDGYSIGVSTPNFIQYVRTGKILPENAYSYRTRSGAEPVRTVASKGGTPYNARFRTFHGGPYDMKSQCTTATNGIFGPNSFQIWAGTPTDSSEYKQAAWRLQGLPTLSTIANNKLSKKLQSKDIDLGVALGEARETAAFVQSAMISCFQAARRARKGDLSGVLKELGLNQTTNAQRQRLRDIPDVVSRAWLGYSYAVRPLMADVFGAVKALEKRHERPTLVTVRAQSTEVVDVELATTKGVLNYPDFGRDVYLSVVGEYGARAKITFEVDNPLLYKLSTVGLTNPLTVAWELIPFSFVVDWFIPIGDFIGSIVPPQGVTKVQRTLTTYGRFYGKGGYRLYQGELPCSINERWKDRSVYSTFPRYHIVGATFDLSVAQISSGLSLLWSFGSGESQESRALRRAQQLQNMKSESAFRQAIQDATHLVDGTPKKRK